MSAVRIRGFFFFSSPPPHAGAVALRVHENTMLLNSNLTIEGKACILVPYR